MATALVTGASSGIGEATAIGLARLGFHVIAGGRAERRLEPVIEMIRRQGGSAEPLVHELSSLDSVRAAAAAVAGRDNRVDVLVNNAGVALSRRRRTVDGFEIRFGVNHLGHFLLTNLLLESMAPSGRVVVVASDAHRSARGIDFDRLRRPGGLVGLGDYAVSKLANVLFARELARRQSRVSTFAVHPGLVDTGIFPGLVKPVIRGRLLTPEEGADTVIWCATTDTLAAGSGGYYSRRAPLTPSPVAQDDDLARALWEHSERWVR